MTKINLLDCTLRDGAYINNSQFGDNVIKGIINNLNSAKIDMIEVGWLKDNPRENGSTYFHTTEDIIPFIPTAKNKKTQFLAMIDYGRYDIKNLKNYDGASIDSIRVVFPKEKFEEAIKFSKQIKEKGYKLCLQAANTQSYSDIELIQLAQLTNTVQPESLSIVDTFGVMYQSDLQRIYMILDNNLNKNIKIGFHSHNNLQLSFALAIEFVQLARMSNREIIIDSSLCGMGRGAGNTCTELVSNYLNIKNNSNYDTNIIMDTIDIYMKGFIAKYNWGYSIPFCIAGQLGSHVNNIAYLQNIHKTDYRDMKIILESLAKEERKLYDYDKLEKTYVNYQNKEVNDSIAIDELKTSFRNKNIILLAPGKTLITEKNKIKNYIINNTPITIGINAISNEYHYDYLFFSNQVRFNYARDKNSEIFNNTKKIITSNITTQTFKNTYIINYNTLMKLGWKYFDNSTIMALRLLAKLEVASVSFAGFDGYEESNNDSYNDIILQNYLSPDEKLALNNDIASMLKDFVLKDKLNTKLQFITDSQFKNAVTQDLFLNI